MEPKYAENIIVGVTFKRKFQWYVTDKLYWKLDYRRLYDEYHLKYQRTGRSESQFVKEVGSFGEFISCRFRIPVLDKDNAKEFLKKIEGNAISGGELAYLFSRAAEEDRINYIPALYVDFDKKEFYSQFPEDEKFERYAPQGWKSGYANFANLIPASERYWAE